MVALAATEARPLSPLAPADIDAGVSRCPDLPSLRVINVALRELVDAENFSTDRIAEVINRDPSLTTRLLRLANSVYYGLPQTVTSLDDAVLYLGVRSIRYLAATTPVIEDMERLVGNVNFPWRGFWQHSIGSAMVAREIASVLRVCDEDEAYVAGLVHDVGIIVEALTWPRHFQKVYVAQDKLYPNLVTAERGVLGTDHAELGALYLQRYRLPAPLVQATRWHHTPDACRAQRGLVTVIYLADLLLRGHRIGYSGPVEPVARDAWRESAAWRLLPEVGEEARHHLRDRMDAGLRHVPAVLEGLV